jgi:hypothetical protein
MPTCHHTVFEDEFGHSIELCLDDESGALDILAEYGEPLVRLSTDETERMLDFLITRLRPRIRS